MESIEIGAFGLSLLVHALVSCGSRGEETSWDMYLFCGTSWLTSIIIHKNEKIIQNFIIVSKVKNHQNTFSINKDSAESSPSLFHILNDFIAEKIVWLHYGFNQSIPGVVHYDNSKDALRSPLDLAQHSCIGSISQGSSTFRMRSLDKPHQIGRATDVQIIQLQQVFCLQYIYLNKFLIRHLLLIKN